MKTSNFLSLNSKDLLKGLLMAALGGGLYTLQDGLRNGFTIQTLKEAGIAAVTSGVAYLIKNLFTPPAIVEKLP